jgi:hypothetical protein
LIDCFVSLQNRNSFGIIMEQLTLQIKPGIHV